LATELLQWKSIDTDDPRQEKQATTGMELKNKDYLQQSRPLNILAFTMNTGLFFFSQSGHYPRVILNLTNTQTSYTYASE
jgi:hypothetical protein